MVDSRKVDTFVVRKLPATTTNATPATRSTAPLAFLLDHHQGEYLLLRDFSAKDMVTQLIN